MKAQPGDWVVVEGATLGVPTRRGQVMEVRHLDGSPPYLVHWLDTGKQTLLFPGPDAHVVTAEDEARRVAAAVEETTRRVNEPGARSLLRGGVRTTSTG